MSRKGGARGGGLVHLKGASSMAVSGLACRKALVDAACKGQFCPTSMDLGTFHNCSVQAHSSV